jgi:hypothetical protein
VFPAEGNALRRMICKSEFKSLTGEIVIYIATPKEQLGPHLQEGSLGSLLTPYKGIYSIRENALTPDARSL